MPRYRHPRVDPDDPAQFAVQLGAEQHTLDAEGCFESDDTAAVERLAAAYDTSAEAMRVNQQDGTDDAEALVKNGECPWCDDYAGDHVGKHASSAHPEEWDAYTED